MSDNPQWLANSVSFKYRTAIEGVLNAGGSCRADQRVHIAGELVGTYKIRLNIAKDSGLNPNGNALIDDLTQLVASLDAEPKAEVTAWFVRQADGKNRFWVFEHRATGRVLASFDFDSRGMANAV